MTIGLFIVWLLSLTLLRGDIGKSLAKPKFTEIFSKSQVINSLSAARLFLFGARDVWFVVALPVYLTQTLEWPHWSVGTFFACWVIGYGFIQSLSPLIIGLRTGDIATGRIMVAWSSALAIITGLITAAVYLEYQTSQVLVAGLLLFGAVFAVNSSLHSYLIVSYSNIERVSMDVGFYYMANAMGRLIGTVLSGLAYQLYGLTVCLLISTAFLTIATLVTCKLSLIKTSS